MAHSANGNWHYDDATWRCRPRRPEVLHFAAVISMWGMTPKCRTVIWVILGYRRTLKQSGPIRRGDRDRYGTIMMVDGTRGPSRPLVQSA